MAPRNRKPATYDDVKAAPPTMVAELLEGQLITSPRPPLGHAAAASVLGAELVGPFQLGRSGPGGWWILDEPEIHLGENVLVPDLAGWRKERLPTHSAADPFLSIAPDWVCEVLSPSTIGLDRARKKQVYAREGVGHIWLIDPLARTLEAFSLQSERTWVEQGAYAGDQRVRAQPFAELELELAGLWVPPPEAAP